MPEYWHHWHQICTQFNQQNHLLDWYNYRLSSLHPQEIIQHIDEIFAEQSTIFKLNVCFGFILQKKRNRQLTVLLHFRNNEQVFQEPFQIATAADHGQVQESLQNQAVLEWVHQRCLNSKWVVEQVTNVTFFITKLQVHPIGRGSDLPPYLRKNNGLLPLDCNHNDNKPYNDNLCFFRALVLHNSCHPKNLEHDAKHYYEQYRETQPNKKQFSLRSQHLCLFPRTHQTGWRGRRRHRKR